MNNKKLYNKSLLFLALLSSLFLLFYYSNNINVSNFPYFSIFNYYNPLRHNTIEYTLEKSIVNNKFILFSFLFIYFNQNNIFFILKKVTKFLVRKSEPITGKFSTHNNIFTGNSTIGYLYISEEKSIHIFNKINLNQVIFYLSSFANFKIFIHQYHKVTSKFKNLFIDGYDIRSTASSINYFDRGAKVLLL
ncbi:hypothetical protein K6025_00955 [Ehrlichia sp. JZT12]